MHSGSAEHADIAVIGGGPGGATLAALATMQGHRVTVLEREKFPRYQIGESLLPATVHGVCKLTGVFDKIEKAGFLRKRGGTFRWGSQPEPWTFAFSLSSRAASRTSYAYQVERSVFDKILLDHARHMGADVREGCAATDVISEDDRVCGVVYTSDTGEVRKLRARYVVDASGNKSNIYRRIGLNRKYSDFFRNLALFGYFEGGKRLPEPNSGNILCEAFSEGWLWYIPLRENLTSVGAVVTREIADAIQGDPENALLSFIGFCPIVSDYLAAASRVRAGQYAEIRVRKDYSYRNSNFWRPGAVLVGDAACFVDPVFSSGVHLATYGALLAARSINSVLAGAIDEAAAFREFELRYHREYSVFYEFLRCFYDMNVDEQSYFWSAKKITQSNAAELESFVDLVAGLSSGEGALADAASMARLHPSRSREFSAAIDGLAGDAAQGMLPVLESQVVRQVMRESAQVQAQAQLGDEAAAEAPLFDQGLVPSSDGMLWTRPAR